MKLAFTATDVKVDGGVVRVALKPNRKPTRTELNRITRYKPKDVKVIEGLASGWRMEFGEPTCSAKAKKGAITTMKKSRLAALNLVLEAVEDPAPQESRVTDSFRAEIMRSALSGNARDIPAYAHWGED